MDLNKTDFKEMTKHPYLEYHIVKSIFTYKDKKGRFESVEELQHVDLIYDQLYEKIRWYFYVKEKSK
jgi:DNA uptake protein ComE-like DNA-binding protein